MAVPTDVRLAWCMSGRLIGVFSSSAWCAHFVMYFTNLHYDNYEIVKFHFSWLVRVSVYVCSGSGREAAAAHITDCLPLPKKKNLTILN